jgi:DNA-binding transcriptional LysR family regulator
MATQAAVGDLELGLLRTFLAVVHHGSLGRTAAAVEMTQPAISQQMMRLERIVGRKLFARGRNGVRLTRHGELLVEYANRAVELNQETLSRLRAESVSGHVALGMSADVALAGLSPALKRFQSIHPDLGLRIVVTTPARLDALLKGGQLDLVIANLSAMKATPSARWLVPLEWAARKDLNVEKSRPIPLVLFENPCSWQEEMLASLRKAGWEWRVTFESASFDAILTAAQSGLGVAALPDEAIRTFKVGRLPAEGLPPAPKVEFGMFPATALASGRRSMLEVAIASLFPDEQRSLGK